MAARLPEPPSLIALDSFYRLLAHLPFEARANKCNFDRPCSLDWELIYSALERIRVGYAIDEPVYLFDRHARGAKTRRVNPMPCVIVDGLFGLYDESPRTA